MSSRSRTSALALVLGAGIALAGCSDIYYDRRETVALGANDAVETNKVIQMVDPWPRYVADKNLAFNGQRMQAAAERYRTNRVIPPGLPTTTSGASQVIQQQAVSTAASQQAFGAGRDAAAAAATAAAPVRGP
jgi:hypothetical protein